MLGDVVFNNSTYIMTVNLIDLEVRSLTIEMVGRVIVIKSESAEWCCRLRDTIFGIVININSCRVTSIQVKNIKISLFNIECVDSYPFRIDFRTINVGTMKIELTIPTVRLINAFIARFNTEKLFYDRLNFTGKINAIEGDITKFNNNNNISGDKLNDPCMLNYTCNYII